MRKILKMSTADHMSGKAVVFMVLLALQFGIQPTLTRSYIHGSDGIIRSTVILVQELLKFCMAAFMLGRSGRTTQALEGWTIEKWLNVAMFPAALYAIQNMASLTAYQNLDALTFNVLNQTKTLSAALCCYIIMGRTQSYKQVISLFLLLLSALTMEGLINLDRLMAFYIPSKPLDNDTDFSTALTWNAHRFTHGVAPLLLASFISGLAGALSQQNLQAAGGGRNPFLFSMELCAASFVFLSLSLLVSDDGHRIRSDGFWKGWTLSTLIPIATNSAGGIIVGLVTKYAGSVRKGFALIFGIFISGVMQSALQPGIQISKEKLVGGALAAISMYLHASNPPTTKKERKVD